MTKPSLREVLGRLGPIQGIDRVPFGSPGSAAIRPAGELAEVNTIAATHALVRRGVEMKVAKAAVEMMVEQGEAQVRVPTIESATALTEDLRAAGVNGLVAVEAETITQAG